MEATTSNLIWEILNHSFTLGKSNNFFSCFLEFRFLSRWVSPKQTLNWKWAKISLNKTEKKIHCVRTYILSSSSPSWIVVVFRLCFCFVGIQIFPFFSFSKDVLVQHLVAKIVVKRSSLQSWSVGNGISDDAKLAWHHLFLQNFKHRQRSNHFEAQGLSWIIRLLFAQN